jgi:hypothetical protein
MEPVFQPLDSLFIILLQLAQFLTNLFGLSRALPLS